MPGPIFAVWLKIIAATVLVSVGATCSVAQSRIALLIGNQRYADKVGTLNNPHNDIELIGKALQVVGFQTTLVKDAGYKAIDTALRLHVRRVRRAGRDTISSVYYSGHGAANPDTKTNYLIPPM